MPDTIISSLARALLQLLAGTMITRGWIEAGDAELLIGALVALLSVVWSVLAKRRTAADLRRAENAVPPALAPMAAQVAEAATTAAATVQEAKGLIAVLRGLVPR